MVLEWAKDPWFKYHMLSIIKIFPHVWHVKIFYTDMMGHVVHKYKIINVYPH